MKHPYKVRFPDGKEILYSKDELLPVGEESPMKEALEESIKLWTWMVDTGKRKSDYPDWGKYHPIPINYCFLCEYQRVECGGRKPTPDNKNFICTGCPYYDTYGCCITKGYPYDLWSFECVQEERKQYAGIFLVQLQAIYDQMYGKPKTSKKWGEKGQPAKHECQYYMVCYWEEAGGKSFEMRSTANGAIESVQHLLKAGVKPRNIKVISGNELTLVMKEVKETVGYQITLGC
jgi:hypothetical protein